MAVKSTAVKEKDVKMLKFAKRKRSDSDEINSYKSLIKLRKRAEPSTDPWRTRPLTCGKLHLENDKEGNREANAVETLLFYSTLV